MKNQTSEASGHPNQPAGEVLKPGGVKFDEAALPCPICGLQPRKVEHRQKGGKVRSVGLRCAGMGTHQVEVTAATEEDARAKWNTRPLPQGEKAVDEPVPAAWRWRVNAEDARWILTFDHPRHHVAVHTVIACEPLFTRPSDTGWQDISTAPKGGAKMLGWDGAEQFTMCWRGADHEPHQDKPGWHEQIYRRDPTHWRPLPAPPTQEDGR